MNTLYNDAVLQNRVLESKEVKKLLMLQKKIDQLKAQANKKNLNKTNNAYTFDQRDRKQLAKKLVTIIKALETEERKLHRMTNVIEENRPLMKAGRYAMTAYQIAFQVLIISSMLQGFGQQLQFLGGLGKGLFAAGSSALGRLKGVTDFVKGLKFFKNGRPPSNTWHPPMVFESKSGGLKGVTNYVKSLKFFKNGRPPSNTWHPPMVVKSKSGGLKGVTNYVKSLKFFKTGNLTKIGAVTNNPPSNAWHPPKVFLSE